MTTHDTFWHRSAATLARIGNRMLERRRNRALAGMPDYLLKDIGWRTGCECLESSARKA
jgi:hypothetical protein